MEIFAGKKILVADDEEGIRDLICTELEFYGAQCFQARSGQEALVLYLKETPDAVISDIRMPDGDGLQFLEGLRQRKIDPCIMIFLTGYTDIPLEEFYERGVSAVMSKPFRLEQIFRTLEMLFQTPRASWRRVPRVVQVLDVELSWDGLSEPLHTNTFNIGTGGMFVQLGRQVPPVGSTLRFVLHYQSGGADRQIEGGLIVRWIRSVTDLGFPVGFGGQFVDLTQDQIDEIASIAGLALSSTSYIPRQ